MWDLTMMDDEKHEEWNLQDHTMADSVAGLDNDEQTVL